MVDERLTAKQAEALRLELEELEGPRRTEVVAAIKKAREFGDLSENFEYHAAKNEQGFLEARIRTLRARLDLPRSSRTRPATRSGSARSSRSRTRAARRSRSRSAPLGGTGTVSPTSPLGSALLGHAVGDTVEVTAPRGAWKATIRAIR